MKFLPRIKQYLTRTRAAIHQVYRVHRAYWIHRVYHRSVRQAGIKLFRCLSQLNDKISKVGFELSRFFFGPLTIILLILLIWRLFDWEGAMRLDVLLGTSNLEDAVETTVKWETIKTLAQALLGLVLIVGIYVAYRRALALDKTAEEQHNTAQALHKTAQTQHNANEQQMFNDATAKLGDKSAASVRLGGIYALDRLARLNETYLASILEILCAHLRETTQQKDYQENHKNEPSNEIQSLLEVLSELNRFSEEKKKDGRSSPVRLNLSGAYLVGANLEDACLNHADLSGTNMREARLSQAQLQEAQMQKTVLQNAEMQKVILKNAKMREVILKNAKMGGAQLQRADLRGAEMQGAHLWETQMQRAILFWAQMQGARLEAAQMQGASLFRAQMQGASLKVTQMQGTDLFETQMQGADLRLAELQGASLLQAQMQGTYLRAAQMQGANVDQMQVQGATLSDVILHGAYCQSPPEEGSGDLPRRIDKRRGKKADLTTVIFSGGLKQEDVQLIRRQLTECQKNEWMTQETVERIIAILEEHQGKPASNQPPSGIKTGSYDEKEADAIIAKYKKAMTTEAMTDVELWDYMHSPID